MAPPTGLWRRASSTIASEPQVGRIVSILLTLVTTAVMSICMYKRVKGIKSFSKISIVRWLIILIYADSLAFVICTGVISNGFGVNYSLQICEGAILMCLICYLTTKFIYYFLIEKVYIIRVARQPRRKNRLYLFNCFGVLLPYCGIVGLNFKFRFANMVQGVCYIGMTKTAVIPLISADVLINVYLTALFLHPLRRMYSYKNNPNSRTRTVAMRTFIGSCCTLASSVVNLTVLMALNGEPGWICLMSCNIDVLFSVLVLQWITSFDEETSTNHTSDRVTTTLPHDVEDGMKMSQLGTHSDTKSSYITTKVTAVGNSSHPTESKNLRAFQPNSITVQRNVNVVEMRDEGRTGEMNSQASIAETEEMPRGSTGSREDLFKNNRSALQQ